MIASLHLTLHKQAYTYTRQLIFTANIVCRWMFLCVFLQGKSLSLFLYKQMSSYLDGHVSGCLLQQPPCQMTAQHLTLHKRVCTNACHNSRYDVLVYVHVCVYAYLSQLVRCVWWYDVDYQSMTVLLIKVHTFFQGQSRFLYKQKNFT